MSNRNKQKIPNHMVKVIAKDGTKSLLDARTIPAHLKQYVKLGDKITGNWIYHPEGSNSAVFGYNNEWAQSMSIAKFKAFIAAGAHVFENDQTDTKSAAPLVHLVAVPRTGTG